jgi:hypothetical protein
MGMVFPGTPHSSAFKAGAGFARSGFDMDGKLAAAKCAPVRSSTEHRMSPPSSRRNLAISFATQAARVGIEIALRQEDQIVIRFKPIGVMI